MKYGIIAAALWGAAFLGSCKKENKSLGGSINPPSYNPALTYLNSRLSQPQIFHVPTDKPDTITTDGGLRFALSAGSFAAGNTPLPHDTVDVAITECVKNGQLIASMMSTAATDASVYRSAATFSISVQHKGQPVQLLQPIKAFVPSADSKSDTAWHISAPQPNTDKTDVNDNLWNRTSNPEPVYDTSSARIYYMISCDHFGWYELDRSRDLSKGTVNLDLEMPVNTLVKTSMATLIMPDLGCVFLYPNETANRFSTYKYKIPKGSNIRILLIQNTNGQLSALLQSFSVNSSGTLRCSGPMSAVSQSSLDDLLKSL